MNEVKEFKVNSFITLKLEYNQTFIYVNNEEFRQCAHLLIDLPKKKLTDFEEIASIDEAEGYYSYYSDLHIPPDVEFWGHCSNLQMWAESNYDTRLLHRDLAFPLLKRLVEIGDLKAKHAFEEEIYKRLESGNKTVIYFLVEEGYLAYLNHDEALFALLRTNEAEAVIEIEKQFETEFSVLLNDPQKEPEGSYIDIRNKHVISFVIELNFLRDYYNYNFLGALNSLPALKHLKIGYEIMTKSCIVKKLKKKLI